MRRALLCLSGYLLIAAGVLWPAPFGGEVLSACAPFVQYGPFPEALRTAAPASPLMGDAMHQFEPWLRYAADAFARSGRIPLWKDSNLCGAPLLANAQSALLWPPNLVAIVLGAPAWLFAWMAMAKFATAALGACLLARHLGASPLGSFLSGAVFAFGGFQVLSMLHPHTNVSALLPWLLLCADRAALQPSGRRVAAVALVAGLQHLGGHPETAFHCQVLASVLVLARAASVAGGAARALSSRSLLYPLAGLLLGAGLAALQLLPFVEYLRLSDTLRERSGVKAQPIVPRAEALLIPIALAAALLFARRLARGAKPALAALGLFAACTLLFVSGRRDGLEYDPALHLAPDWFGGHADFHGVGNYVLANSGYAGAALALAILGLIDGRPRSVARVAAGVLVLGALVGRNMPLVTPLLERLPLFEVAANTRLQLFELIALAVLAGLGLDRLGVAGLRPRFVGAMAAVATAAIVALSISIARGDHQAAKVIGAVRRAHPMAAEAIEPAHASTGPRVVAGWVALPSEVTSAVLLFGRARTWALSLVPLPTAARAADPELVRVPEPAYVFRAQGVEGLPAGTPYRVLCTDAEGRSWLSSWLEVPRGFPSWLLAASIPEGAKSPIQLAFLAAAVLLVVFACAAQGHRLNLMRVALVILVLGSLVYFAYDIPPTVPPEQFYPRSSFIDDIARLRPDGRGLVFADGSLALRSEIGAAYHLLEPTGYDAMAPALVVSVLRAATADEQQSPAHWMLPTRLDVDRRLLGLMAVRAFAHSTRIPVAGQELRSSEPGLRLTANEDYRPRARLASSSIVERDDTRALARLRDPEFDADTVILSRAPRETPLGPVPTAGAGPAATARVAVDESDLVEVDVSGNEGGFLVLADTDFPGWTARVDGVEREIIRANVAFRAVAVRPGDRVVSFEYRPASFRIGCAVSLLCGLSLIALSMRSRIRTTGKPA